MTDPMKDLFDNLNQSTPAPKNMAENKAVFLATAHRMSVTSGEDKRHQRVNAYITKGELPMKFRFNRKRTSALVVLFAILMVAGGVLANSIFNFFAQADTDNMDLEVTVGTLDSSQFTLGNAQLPAFFDNLAQALASTSYDAKAPQAIPAGYQFTTATYQTQSNELFQNYQCGDASLSLSQRPLGQDEGFSLSVGASASIIPVNVGDGGEYVRGGWVTDGDAPAITLDGNTSTTTTTNVELNWSNELSQHTMMWTENGMLYSLSTSVSEGACALTQADILAFANSLK